MYELLSMTEDAMAHVHPSVQEDLLRTQAVSDGMRPLRAVGAMKVAQGLTTLEEVLRTTPPLRTPRGPVKHPVAGPRRDWSRSARRPSHQPH